MRSENLSATANAVLDQTDMPSVNKSGVYDAGVVPCATTLEASRKGRILGPTAASIDTNRHSELQR
jgi:hypothetical protein